MSSLPSEPNWKIFERTFVSGCLFQEQTAIEDALVELVGYLTRAEQEWSQHKREVNAVWSKVGSAARIFSDRGMTWVEDFVAGRGAYIDGYDVPVRTAKGAMREAIFILDRSG